MGDPTRGLYGKFYVNRVDKRDEAGQKHEHCSLFVLDLTHDLHARRAALEYASSCRAEYPLLADDLLREVERAGGVRDVVRYPSGDLTKPVPERDADSGGNGVPEG